MDSSTVSYIRGKTRTVRQRPRYVVSSPRTAIGWSPLLASTNRPKPLALSPRAARRPANNELTSLSYHKTSFLCRPALEVTREYLRLLARRNPDYGCAGVPTVDRIINVLLRNTHGLLLFTIGGL